MKKLRKAVEHLLILSLAICANVVAAQEYTGEFSIDADSVNVGQPEYSPYLHQSYPTEYPRCVKTENLDSAEHTH